MATRNGDLSTPGKVRIFRLFVCFVHLDGECIRFVQVSFFVVRSRIFTILAVRLTAFSLHYGPIS